MDKSQSLSMASGHFLTESFPPHSAKMSDGALMQYIDKHKSHLVVCKDATVILSAIKSFAETIREVHENAKN